MGVQVKNVKLTAIKFHIYNGQREPGATYEATPADAEKIVASGRAKYASAKDKKQAEASQETT